MGLCSENRVTNAESYPLVWGLRDPPRSAHFRRAPCCYREETAKLLGVCKATVYAMIERDEIEHVRVSNMIRIVVRDARRSGSV